MYFATGHSRYYRLKPFTFSLCASVMPENCHTYLAQLDIA
ncbi:hypothetical protein HMPREF0880_04703 [Yokenella regensburgei ATCC 43003]|nr:hypothetical protein HMPREF0880_04703 [Yokenella regensburgei ATCC 43003]